MSEQPVPELREGNWIKSVTDRSPVWSEIRILDTCGSTQNEARAAAAAGHAGGLVVAARTQTGGRGRQDKVWDSGRGGLWFSILIPPPQGRASSAFALAAGLAVRDMLTGYIPEPIGLKWPNDVIAGGGKIAGILTESSIAENSPGWMIVGIGININNTPDPALAPGAVSASAIAGHRLDPSRMFAAILTGLSLRIDGFKKYGFSPMASEYTMYCVLRGATVRVEQGSSSIEGVVERVDHEGYLQLTDRSGAIRSIAAGTVTFIGRGGA